MSQKHRIINDILNRLGKNDQAQNSTTNPNEATVDGPNSTSTASHVERMLNSKTDILLGEGWYFNIKWGVDITLDGNNKAEVGRLETKAAVNISGISEANPAVVTTSTNHKLQTGDRVYIASVAGMTEVNDRYYTVKYLTDTTYSLDGVNSTGYTTWTSGGTSTGLYKIYHVDTWGSDASINVVRQGEYLYDQDDNEDIHGGDMKVTYIYEVDWTEIPQPFVEYLTACTAYYFNRAFLNNTNADAALSMEMMKSDASMRRAQTRQDDVNLLNTYEAAAIRGRSRYTTRRTNPLWP
jgi:hypothetical protein